MVSGFGKVGKKKGLLVRKEDKNLMDGSAHWRIHTVGEHRCIIYNKKGKLSETQKSFWTIFVSEIYSLINETILNKN